MKSREIEMFTRDIGRVSPRNLRAKIFKCTRELNFARGNFTFREIRIRLRIFEMYVTRERCDEV